MTHDHRSAILRRLVAAWPEMPIGTTIDDWELVYSADDGHIFTNPNEQPAIYIETIR